MLRVASNRETLDSPPSRPPTEGSHDCTFRKLAPHSWGLTAGPPLAHAPQRLTAAHALAGHPPQPPRPALSRAPSSSSFPQSLGYPLARSPARPPAGPTSPHNDPAPGPAAHLISRSPPRAARSLPTLVTGRAARLQRFALPVSDVRLRLWSLDCWLFIQKRRKR